jgi:hypothetical protein
MVNTSELPSLLSILPFYILASIHYYIEVIYMEKDLKKFVLDLTSDELVYLLYSKHIISFKPPTTV